jgi:predicted NBD/HSP70 family sugar kinase
MNGHRGSLFGHERGGDTADLREHNLALVLRYLRDHGPSSRAEIAESSKLGLSTLTGMIGELKELELVTECLAGTRTRLGRPTHSVSLSGDAWVVAGLRVDVDGVQAKTSTVGGTHLGSYAERSDLRGGDPVTAIRMLRAAIDWILESIDARRALTAITVTVPGRVSPDGDTVARSESLGWYDVDVLGPVREQLEAGGCRGTVVELASDSVAAALGLVRGELHDRIGGRTALYFGGERTVAGGILVAGEPMNPGRSGADFAGIPVSVGGRAPQRLGNVLALSTLVQNAGVSSREDAATFVDLFPREALSALSAALEEGQGSAYSALEEAMPSLSQAIESAVAILGADVVVLDGYLGALGARVAPAVGSGVELIALPGHASRVVDGAVCAARDACLAQPSRIRPKLEST